MPESPSEMMERIHLVQIDHAKTSQRVETLEKENGLVWTAIDKTRDAVTSIREQLSQLRIQVAGIVGGISIIQTIVVAWIVYKTNKGG
jgi:dynactin complex subunit